MRNEKTLTTGQIADHCDVHYRTVIRWIDRGRLRAYQLPDRGDRRVRVNDFLAFLKDNNMPIPKELQPGKPRVLIVEDDKNVAKSIERMLRRAGFDTEVALDGFTAGTLVERFEPQVMTLDLQMPGLSGFDVLKELRAAQSPPIKVLIVSAMPDFKLNAALEAGADAVLTKPFRNEELVRAVRELAGVDEVADAGEGGDA